MKFCKQIALVLLGAALPLGATAASDDGMQTYTYLQIHEWVESPKGQPTEVTAVNNAQLKGFRAGVVSTFNIISAFNRDSIKAHNGKRLCLPTRDLTGEDIHEAIMLAVGPYDYDDLLQDVDARIGYGPAAGAAYIGLQKRFPCEESH